MRRTITFLLKRPQRPDLTALCQDIWTFESLILVCLQNNFDCYFEWCTKKGEKEYGRTQTPLITYNLTTL